MSKSQTSSGGVSENIKRRALALAFGVVMTSGLISGVPGQVPGLTRALSCVTCKIQLKNGLPTQFVAYMSDEQKRKFKNALRSENDG